MYNARWLRYATPKRAVMPILMTHQSNTCIFMCHSLSSPPTIDTVIVSRHAGAHFDKELAVLESGDFERVACQEQEFLFKCDRH